MKDHYPRIGYACMNMDIVPNNYQTCRLSHMNSDRLESIIRNNLDVLEKSIDYNIRYGNKLFRISSSLIPFGLDSLKLFDWIGEYRDDFERIRNKIRDHQIRISMHPGQYTVLNSPDRKVVEASIEELKYHAEILDLLSSDPSHKMILHVGGVYGDKQAAMNRFIEVYRSQLDECIRKYLVIENDDRLFTVEDVLTIASQIPIPVVFDNLHHAANPSLEDLSMETVVDRVVKTWKEVDGRPKFHYSQQALGKRIGAHSDTIDLDRFKVDYENIYQLHLVDIMLEVKDKNRSFVKVHQYLYPLERTMEEEWARYKYWVMARSQKAYLALRTLFKENRAVDVLQFYQIVDSLRTLEINKKSQINAFQHVWGYFKDKASSKEKDKFMKMIDQYQRDEIDSKAIYRYLKKLAVTYHIPYLLNSYYFD